MKFHRALTYLLALSLSLLSAAAISKPSKKEYKLNYTIGFQPKKKTATVEIEIEQKSHVSKINFNLSKSQCYHFSSSDKLEREGKRLVWYPHKSNGKLTYMCKINHRRSRKSKRAYDAYMTSDWAIFRGDDLVPAARVSSKPGAQSKAKLIFDLPDSWPSVNTGWEPLLDEDGLTSRFVIDNPQRRFDRPTGWMIAGNLGTRRSMLGTKDIKTRVSVSAPKGSEFRRMDTLAFINVLWPEFEKAFGMSEEHILILGADDPMWRGGLSAGNSFYIHSDRPIVSENGTSTLTHELFHMVTGIRGTKNNDWIAEGLAEYYSVELLNRASATNAERRQQTMEKLQQWSSDVGSIFTSNSKGETTAKAALIFNELNKEVLSLTKNEHNLDAVTRLLMSKAHQGKRVSFKDLQNAFFEVTQSESSTLTAL